MKSLKLFTLALLASTTAAYAAPRETFDLVALNGGPLQSVNRQGFTPVNANSVVDVAVNGFDGSGTYTVARLNFTATSGAHLAASWGSEARVHVTPPAGGTPFIVQFSTCATGGCVPTGTNFAVSACPVDAAVTTGGTWRFETFDSFDDTGTDMVWAAMSVQFDDAPPVVPSVAPVEFSASYTLVPSDGTATANSGTATDAARTRTLTAPAGTTINRIKVSGFVTTLTNTPATNTSTQFTPETRIRVTAPGAQVVTIVPIASTGISGTGMTNATGGITGGTNSGGVVSVPVASQDSGGNWVFLFHESTNQAVVAGFGGIDSVWNIVNVGLAGPATLTNPAITATSATPATVGTSGQTTVLTATVVPGTNPASTALTVTADLTAIGGPSNAAFHDDGLDGDAVANNGVYSYQQLVSGTAGAKIITITAADAELRSGSNTVTVTLSPPTNPTLTGLLFAGNEGATILFTTTVTPGNFPPSTGLAVTADMTSLGLSNAEALFDDGTNGDAVAGNNVFSRNVTLPAASSDSLNIITVTVTDAQSRTNNIAAGVVVRTLTPTWDEAAHSDPGNLPGTATDLTDAAYPVIVGTLGADDQEMFKIYICDAANFSATSRFSATTYDTQLFLFAEDGTGVVMNDDNPAGVLGSTSGTLSSTIRNVAGLTAGVYHLAVTRYDNDPRNAANQFIWLDTDPVTGGFNTQRAPDGTTTGAAGGPPVTDFVIANWDNADNTQGPYRLSLTGTCAQPPAICSISDVGVQGGTPGQDRRLNNNDFVVFINFFFALDMGADLGVQGGTPGQDGLLNNNDFVVFINAFFADGPNCTG